MSAEILNDGGPAFPCEIGGDPANNHHQTGAHTAMQYGMSRRDYFAGQALAGICAHTDTWGQHLKGIAATAYELADLMISVTEAPK